MSSALLQSKGGWARCESCEAIFDAYEHALGPLMPRVALEGLGFREPEPLRLAPEPVPEPLSVSPELREAARLAQERAREGWVDEFGSLEEAMESRAIKPRAVRVGPAAAQATPAPDAPADATRTPGAPGAGPKRGRGLKALSTDTLWKALDEGLSAGPAPESDTQLKERLAQKLKAAARERELERRLAKGLPVDDEEPLAAASWSAPMEVERIHPKAKAGLIALIVLALAQGLWLARAELSTRSDWARGALQGICGPGACLNGSGANLALFELVSSDMRESGGVAHFSALVASKASARQPAPWLELELRDESGKAISRRRFAPMEWLGAEELGAGEQRESRLDFAAASANGFNARLIAKP